MRCNTNRLQVSQSTSITFTAVYFHSAECVSFTPSPDWAVKYARYAGSSATRPDLHASDARKPDEPAPFSLTCPHSLHRFHPRRTRPVPSQSPALPHQWCSSPCQMSEAQEAPTPNLPIARWRSGMARCIYISFTFLSTSLPNT